MREKNPTKKLTHTHTKQKTRQRLYPTRSVLCKRGFSTFRPMPYQLSGDCLESLAQTHTLRWERERFWEKPQWKIHLIIWHSTFHSHHIKFNFNFYGNEQRAKNRREETREKKKNPVKRNSSVTRLASMHNIHALTEFVRSVSAL